METLFLLNEPFALQALVAIPSLILAASLL